MFFFFFFFRTPFLSAYSVHTPAAQEKNPPTAPNRKAKDAEARGAPRQQERQHPKTGGREKPQSKEAETGKERTRGADPSRPQTAREGRRTKRRKPRYLTQMVSKIRVEAGSPLVASARACRRRPGGAGEGEPECDQARCAR